MSFYKKKFFQKIISATLIFSFLLPLIFLGSFKKTNAQWVVIDPAHIGVSTANVSTNVSRSIKEYVADALAYMVPKIILRRLTAQTVNWINSGFKGNPAFITNPGQFFLDVGDQITSDFLSTTALNRLCSPFQLQVRVALSKNYLQEDPFGYTCTLGRVADNYDNFINNFTEGGWDSWFQITQRSQNNPYGAYQAAQNELAVRIGSQQDKYQRQLNWGSGFLSYERCKPGTEVAPRNEFGEIDEGVPVDCLPEDKETVTPGKVIDDQLGKALGSSWSQLEAADEINEIINALVVQLTQQIINGAASGLRGLTTSSPNNENRAIIENLSRQTTSQDEALVEQIRQDAQRLVDELEQANNDSIDRISQDPNLVRPGDTYTTFPPTEQQF